MSAPWGSRACSSGLVFSAATWDLHNNQPICLMSISCMPGDFLKSSSCNSTRKALLVSAFHRQGNLNRISKLCTGRHISKAKAKKIRNPMITTEALKPWLSPDRSPESSLADPASHPSTHICQPPWPILLFLFSLILIAPELYSVPFYCGIIYSLSHH